MAAGEVKIVLIGFMGTGKSSVAQHLSELHHKEYVDLDEYIVDAENRSIPELFEDIGEVGFRKLETIYLARVVKKGFEILAIGGGTWISEKNREIINSTELKSVWLDASFETCWRNISESKRVRPLAQSKSRAKRIFMERRQLYELADTRISIGREDDSVSVSARVSACFGIDKRN